VALTKQPIASDPRQHSRGHKALLKQQVPIRPAYPVNEFCNAFGISRSKAYTEIRAGRLKAFKIGDKTMIAGEDGLAWREQYRAQGYRRGAYPDAA
jgi:hypothetical protein